MTTTVLFKGNPVGLGGELPKVGAPAPDFQLTTDKLESVTLKSFAGKVKILTTNPSIDTGVCATTMRTFSQKSGGLTDTVLVYVSGDLPFALKRFCAAEGIANVVSGSTLRDPGFGDRYGLRLTGSALENLLARAVIVIGKDDRVKYVELVPEIASEPSYDAALAAAKAATEG
jgi:thioredoxin-dependent peroxiredoxin